MAVLKAVTTFFAESGVTDDHTQTELHFQIPDGLNAGDTAAHAQYCADAIEQLWNVAEAGDTFALAQLIGSQISRTVKPECNVYELFVVGAGTTADPYRVASGSPVITDTWGAMLLPFVDTQMPDEVALVMSYNADLSTVPERTADKKRPRARRRGRMNVGPLCQSAQNGVTARPRPDANTTIRHFGSRLAQEIGGVLDVAWIVFSEANVIDAVEAGGPPPGGLYVNAGAHPVVRVSTDDSFDTQRRRGRIPTARVFQNV